MFGVVVVLTSHVILLFSLRITNLRYQSFGRKSWKPNNFLVD